MDNFRDKLNQVPEDVKQVMDKVDSDAEFDRFFTSREAATKRERELKEEAQWDFDSNHKTKRQAYLGDENVRKDLQYYHHQLLLQLLEEREEPILSKDDPTSSLTMQEPTMTPESMDKPSLEPTPEEPSIREWTPEHKPINVEVTLGVPRPVVIPESPSPYTLPQKFQRKKRKIEPKNRPKIEYHAASSKEVVEKFQELES